MIQGNIEELRIAYVKYSALQNYHFIIKELAEEF